MTAVALAMQPTASCFHECSCGITYTLQGFLALPKTRGVGIAEWKHDENGVPIEWMIWRDCGTNTLCHLVTLKSSALELSAASAELSEASLERLSTNNKGSNNV